MRLNYLKLIENHGFHARMSFSRTKPDFTIHVMDENRELGWALNILIKCHNLKKDFIMKSTSVCD